MLAFRILERRPERGGIHPLRAPAAAIVAPDNFFKRLHRVVTAGLRVVVMRLWVVKFLVEYVGDDVLEVAGERGQSAPHHAARRVAALTRIGL